MKRLLRKTWLAFLITPFSSFFERKKDKNATLFWAAFLEETNDCKLDLFTSIDWFICMLYSLYYSCIVSFLLLIWFLNSKLIVIRLISDWKWRFEFRGAKTIANLHRKCVKMTMFMSLSWANICYHRSFFFSDAKYLFANCPFISQHFHFFFILGTLLKI